MLAARGLTAQAGMGVMYELDAIAMAVIGGISLSGGRGSIVGTMLGMVIFGVIISGFTFIRLDAYYQEMIKGMIIVAAVVARRLPAAAPRGRTELEGDNAMATQGHPQDRRPHQALWRRACAGGRRLRAPRRRARRHRRRQRRRQVHLRAPDHRRRAARPRGKIFFDGEEVDFKGPIEAREAGIETVFQNLALADDLDVPSNLFLGREKFLLQPRPVQFLNERGDARSDARRRWSGRASRSRTSATRSATCPAASASASRSAAPATFASKLIIMDEPTAALGVQETAQVENIIRNLKARGIPLILVSHNLRQVFDLVDRIGSSGAAASSAVVEATKTDGNEVVAYITGVKSAEFAGAAT